MKKINFRYKNPPNDLLRNTDIIELPNPNNNPDDFLVWFLDNYQSDERIAYLDDLYKLLNNEFSEEFDRLKFIEINGEKTKEQVKEEINLLEEELKREGYRNFFNLILNNQIEIIELNNA